MICLIMTHTLFMTRVLQGSGFRWCCCGILGYIVSCLLSVLSDVLFVLHCYTLEMKHHWTL